MGIKSTLAVGLLSLLCRFAHADIVYQLDQHFDRLAGKYDLSVSGSVTTDGTLGVLTSIDFVKDWSITVITPSAVDGIASETLTPANSTLSLTLRNSPGLLVTAESIVLASPPANSDVLLNELIWATLQNETVLTYRSAYVRKSVGIVDASEPNGYIGIDAGVAAGTAIAAGGVAVPEPNSAFCLFSLALAGFHLRPRR